MESKEIIVKMKEWAKRLENSVQNIEKLATSVVEGFDKDEYRLADICHIQTKISQAQVAMTNIDELVEEYRSIHARTRTSEQG